MPVTENPMPQQPANRDRGAPTRPVLFLHIPKTAGTSFLMMLRNTFADRRVHRVAQMDQHIQSTIDRIVDNDLDQISCLTGHLPMHLFGRHLDRFQPFTILREPVARILSLYRFLRDGSPAEVEQLGLRPNFELGELLESDKPELFGQVNNGMVRQLCGNARVNTSWVGAFWNGREDQDALRAAFANLGRMDFGLAEDMPATLELARACWAVPYELREYRENTTRPETSHELLEDIRDIIARNSLDLTLYRQAAVLFRERVRKQRQSPPVTNWNPAAVFVPPGGRATSIAEIPGRQGFHEYRVRGRYGLDRCRPIRQRSLPCLRRTRPAPPACFRRLRRLSNQRYHGACERCARAASGRRVGRAMVDAGDRYGRNRGRAEPSDAGMSVVCAGLDRCARERGSAPARGGGFFD